MLRRIEDTIKNENLEIEEENLFWQIMHFLLENCK
jgi:hypothetical protein